ncbi:hypothetical protein AnigIFM60653_002617 [Aspergillus niger]|nr:hypothetical protein AnigIFM60653_002617 [Aspergillus niger]
MKRGQPVGVLHIDINPRMLQEQLHNRHTSFACRYMKRSQPVSVLRVDINLRMLQEQLHNQHISFASRYMKRGQPVGVLRIEICSGRKQLPSNMARAPALRKSLSRSQLVSR